MGVNIYQNKYACFLLIIISNFWNNKSFQKALISMVIKAVLESQQLVESDACMSRGKQDPPIRKKL